VRAARLGAAVAGLLFLLAAPIPTGADASAVRLANAQAARWYQDGSPALFVDLRTPGERAQGGRPARALWVPLGGNGRDNARLVDAVLRAVDGDRARAIVLVCREGVKAAAAAEALQAHGFAAAVVVDGGLWAGEPWLAFELE
jgi:rhodanese-related sulfurtransferase